ncbi:uncharacterized protein LOC110450436 [Mizuhopecten yessoensis]|uniref:Uncharacterized protein n=1 Tax=Mizuhopecten yessoensis TaxID=6573 RepID=A0A210QNQ1_MIZYE|nr:uncharacterized protein LOC110450436 [Mizuhopecten yessoensis]OWF50370.1 hypothetical protein KP79_PYT09477 [Mizuhopecten yessoensis]
MASTTAKSVTDDTSQTNDMSLEDKLAYLDKEIRLLHRFCTESGYSQQHIERCAEPFFRPIRSAKRKKLRCHLILVTAAVAVFSALLYIDPAYRLMASSGRLAYIKILPYWDWSAMFDWNCLINNPLFTDDLKEDDCKSCVDIDIIERVSDLDSVYFAEEYLKKDVPVIVEDGLKGWPEQNITVAKIKELYEQHKIMMQHSVCNLTTSITGKKDKQSPNHRRVFAEIRNQDFFLQWENCHPKAGKAFRSEFYRRPYFMPQMVEVDTSNWLLMSHGKPKFEAEPLLVPIHKQLLILIQLKGEVMVHVVPDKLCETQCKPVTSVLSEGQILLVTMTDVLYDVLYLPYGDEENISIAIHGNYD